MKDRTLKSNLYHSLGQEVQPKRLEETINYCTEIMKEQMLYKEEPRTSFFQMFFGLKGYRYLFCRR